MTVGSTVGRSVGPMPGLHDRHDYRSVTVSDYFSLLLIVACSRFHGDANIIQRMTYADRRRPVFAQQTIVEILDLASVHRKKGEAGIKMFFGILLGFPERSSQPRICPATIRRQLLDETWYVA